MTQFANFGALALATTGQHERWPDYAVSMHNWPLEYAKFSILHECQKLFLMFAEESVSPKRGNLGKSKKA